MTGKRRVVVTGLGAVTPLGIGVKPTWEALLAGRSGIGPITKYDPNLTKTRIAGEVKGFNSEDFMNKKDIRKLDVFIHYAVAAARMAQEDARLTITEELSGEAGCIMGSGLGGLRSIEDCHQVVLEKGADRLSPFFVPMVISNLAPGQVSIELGLKGPNLLIATACAAGTHAIGQGYRHILYGDAKVMFVGGAEATITTLGVGGFNAMRALTTRNDEPEKASRPFEKDRDGFVPAEGSGMLVLEDLEYALERGARIYAEVAGFGMSGDAFHIAQPPEGHVGAVRAIRRALEDAGMAPEEIDYINAHGTSTQLNDLYETQAVKTVFGEHAYKLAISSTKSMTGHLLGAAGGVEGVFSVLTLHHGVLPPTVNYDTPDPECDLDFVPNQARAAQVRTVMSNSFGFGGTNGSLIFKAYQP